MDLNLKTTHFFVSSGDGIFPLKLFSSIFESLFILRQSSMTFPLTSLVYFAGSVAIIVSFTLFTYREATLDAACCLRFKSSRIDASLLPSSVPCFMSSLRTVFSSGCLLIFLQYTEDEQARG